MRVFIFGDSITQGYFGTKSGGWATMLVSQAMQQSLQNLDGEWLEIFNLGISGDGAEGVLNRIEAETVSRRLSDDDEAIVLAIGANDAVLRDNKPEQDVYQFQETYEKLLEKVTKITSRVLCVGLTAVDESQTNPWPYSSTGKQWLNNRVNLFEDAVKQAAVRKQVPFVPIHDQFLAGLEAGKDLLADGLHPNDAGHELIVSLVKPEIDNLLK